MKKSGDNGVVSPKTFEQKDTENTKTDEKEPEKTVSNVSDAILNLKMIKTTLRLLTMMEKKQSQRTVMEMLHLKRIQRRLGLLGTT